jgi:hypothetical protein
MLVGRIRGLSQPPAGLHDLQRRSRARRVHQHQVNLGAVGHALSGQTQNYTHGHSLVANYRQMQGLVPAHAHRGKRCRSLSHLQPDAQPQCPDPPRTVEKNHPHRALTVRIILLQLRRPAWLQRGMPAVRNHCRWCSCAAPGLQPCSRAARVRPQTQPKVRAPGRQPAEPHNRCRLTDGAHGESSASCTTHTVPDHFTTHTAQLLTKFIAYIHTREGLF